MSGLPASTSPRAAIENVPGAPHVTLKTDPQKSPGLVEGVTDAGEVRVFWLATRRRWTYKPDQLRPIRAS